MNNSISVIVLNYNGKLFLENCFLSLKKQTLKPFEIIMVDNGSSDGSVEYIRKAFPGIRVIENKVNSGFAGGNNIGVEAAKGKYIVLLNNDVIVNKNWLAELYKTFNNKVQLAGSAIHNEGEPLSLLESSGTLNILGRSIPGVFTDLTKSFYASGCSLIFNKEIVGSPFDNDYFVYHEDVYLGWKIRLQGGEVKNSPHSIVNHLNGKTTEKIKGSIITFYQERNRILNLLIFYQFKTILKIFPLLLLDLIFRFFVIAILRKKSLIGFIKSGFWIIFHFRLCRQQYCYG